MKFLVMCYVKKKGNGKQGRAHKFAPARWICLGAYKQMLKAQNLRDMLINAGVKNCAILQADTAQQARQILQAGA